MGGSQKLWISFFISVLKLRATFPSFYRSMISSVVNGLKAIPVPKKTTPLTDEQLEDRLHYLAISTKVLYLLMNLVKVSLLLCDGSGPVM